MVLLAFGELFARFGLGLGSPVIWVFHPTIEYMVKPNQEVFRFHNRIKINAYGMRSDDFALGKMNLNEIRVIVYGDSVINGGSLTDQSEVCTEIAKSVLQDQARRPIVVGNISAGSWGPANMLAYRKAYGNFDADLVVVVLSDHDWKDAPTFRGLNPASQPSRRPWTALGEGLGRYLLPRIRGVIFTNSKDISVQEIGGGVQAMSPLDAFDQLVNVLSDGGVPVLVMLLGERKQMVKNLPMRGVDALEAVARAAGADVIRLVDVFRDNGVLASACYRDEFHLSPKGQDLVGQAIAEWSLMKHSVEVSPWKDGRQGVGDREIGLLLDRFNRYSRIP